MDKKTIENIEKLINSICNLLNTSFENNVLNDMYNVELIKALANLVKALNE